MNEWKAPGRKRAKTLTKDAFPSLLTKLHQRLHPEGDISTNLQSGFKNCGIYPFDESKVISRLPDSNANITEADNVVSRRVSDTVVAMLKTMRLVDETVPKKRKKRSVFLPVKASLLVTQDLIMRLT